MSDSRLDGMLRSLPRHVASDGFSAGVMTRLARENHPRRTRFAPLAWKHSAQAAAAALLVVLSVLGGVMYERHEEAKRIAAIRTEAMKLQAELDALKRESQKQGEIYLGQAGDREYLLNLRQLTAPAADVRQVSHQY